MGQGVDYLSSAVLSPLVIIELRVGHANQCLVSWKTSLNIDHVLYFHPKYIVYSLIIRLIEWEG